MDLISSSSNPTVKRVRRLRQRKYRRRDGAFFVEGLRGVLAALEQGAAVETLLYAPDLLTSEHAETALAAAAARGAACLALTADVFAALSDRDNPVGIGAVVAMTVPDLATLTLAPDDVWVALVDVGDPGNLGTIIRTVDSAGAAGVILVGQTTDPFHPSAVKASMGSLFTVPLAQAADAADLLAWAGAGGARLVATSAHAEVNFWDAPHDRPALLLLGSERHGLPPDLMAAADLRVTIPMAGAATSLNLAVAAGILIYEWCRPI